MAVKKTYEVAGPRNRLTLNTKTVVEVPYGNKKKLVERSIKMKGRLRPVRHRGTFTTSEQALIEALDRDIERAGDKPQFIIRNEVEIPDSQAEKTPKIVKTVDGDERFETDVAPHEIAEKGEVPKRKLKTAPREVTGISSVTKAAKWLRDNFEDVTSRDVSNKEKTTRVAAEKNIKFTDLR